MSEDHKKNLEAQLWNIANELRGKMDADEFRDYILGFIFYKYLSEKLHLYANELLATEDTKEYTAISDVEVLDAVSPDIVAESDFYDEFPEQHDSAALETKDDKAPTLKIQSLQQLLPASSPPPFPRMNSA